MSQTTDTNKDDVAVYKEFDQVFSTARPVNCSVKTESKLMEHPIETGAVVTDHKVDQPISLELAMIVQAENYRDVYAEIKDIYTKGELLTVQTRVSTFENQVIEALPHEETSEMQDTIEITLKLKEVKIVTAEYQDLPPRKVKKPNNASTKKTGEVQPQEAKQGSWAHGAFGKKNKG